MARDCGLGTRLESDRGADQSKRALIGRWLVLDDDLKRSLEFAIFHLSPSHIHSEKPLVRLILLLSSSIVL